MAAENVYDCEFERYLDLARYYIEKLDSIEDRRMACNWIKKLCAMDSDEITVKKCRIQYFKYLLTVLRIGGLTGPFAQNPPEGPITDSPVEDLESYEFELAPETGAVDWLKVGLEDRSYFSHWSPDGRTYVASKPIPGRGAIVYMAVATDPSYGWDIPADTERKNV